MNKEEAKMDARPGFWYGMTIMLILNSFVFPYLLNKKIVETDYGTFVEQVEDGKVSEVSIDKNTIYFTVLETERKNYYKPGVMDAPSLVDRLLRADEVGRKAL